MRPKLLFLLLVFWLSPLNISTAATADKNPLRPADTSSPRDTLTSFLQNTNQFITDYRQNNINEKSYHAFRRAGQTLDFSSTTEGDSWFVRTRRIALLHELLARIDLPPNNQIPGDNEVAKDKIQQWKIPNTDITITRITLGPRAEQYLFSADTVQNLDRLYRQAKHLPYKPGTVSGVYEELVSAESQLQQQEKQIRARLQPVDTSSPRATLEGFLDHVNRAYEIVNEANNALQSTPPTMTREQAREAETAATQLLQRASETLDFSHIPEALRASVTIETTLQLKEIFDRMFLPPLDATPTLQMIEAMRKETADRNNANTQPYRWKVPNTQIEIVEIQEGDRQGQFLFSAGTIRRINDIYKKIHELPYRQVQFGGTEQEYLSPGISPGFYDKYLTASGYLIPQAHLRGRLVEFLPDWLKVEISRQMLWQWISLMLCVVGAILVLYYLSRYTRALATHLKSPLHDWLRVLSVATILAFFILLEQFIATGLKFTGHLHAIVTTLTATTIFLSTAWFAFVFCLTIAITITSSARMRELSSESALLRIAASILGFLIAVTIIVDGLRTLGADLIPLLAGLGIGGLAVALAAQTTIANFIGGLILLANKPVRIGDFCRYGEDPSKEWLRIGTVEEINWISTRIRGIDRTVTTIPNAEFSNMHIVNLTKRDQRLMRTTLQLRYETTPEQMRYILVKLRELLLAHPMVSAEPARVRMIGFGAYSKDVEIYCYLMCIEQNEFLAIQEDLLLRIEDIIVEAGSGFAFPSQTAYLSKDKGLDDEKREEAETQIGHMRFTGKLPFPEFEEEDRDRLENTLDYPPKGSPHHKPEK